MSVIGVRRAGKSFILRQVARKISKVWGKENVAFVNLEDVRFTELSPELLNTICEAYLEHLNPAKKPLLLVDEIHRVKG